MEKISFSPKLYEDISPGPVAMMNYRIQETGLNGRTIEGNFLENEFAASSFDFVVSIGCFHHTGSIKKCIAQTFRILKDGGSALIMVYNQFSLRQWINWPIKTMFSLTRKKSVADVAQRRAYDRDSKGVIAPFTEFISIRTLKMYFANFSQTTFRKENCVDIRIWRFTLFERKTILPYVGPLLGLDIYIEAQK